MDGHTILLLQAAPQKSSCTYIEYPTTAEAIDGLCALFERRLKEMNPGVKNITYDISELYQFMESLPDLTALVLDESICAYVPFDRKRLKELAYQRLSKLAGVQ